MEKQQLLGTFTGDVLATALGNLEHSGRTRGVGSFAPWKTGRNWTLEDKRASKKAKKEQHEAEFRAKIVADILGQLRRGELHTLEKQPSVDKIPSSCASQAAATIATGPSYRCDNIEVYIIKHVDHAK